MHTPDPTSSPPPVGPGQPAPPSAAQSGGWRHRLVTQYPWLVFIAPFVVYMALNSLEPKPPPSSGPDANQAAANRPVADEESSAGETASDGSAVEPAESEVREPSGAEEPPPESGWLPTIPYAYYPLVYTAKIALTLAVMVVLLPGYRQFPLRVSPLAVVVGAVGCVVWVGLCRLGLERRLGEAWGLAWLVDLGQRSSYNPLAELAAAGVWAYAFLAVRFVGLAGVVPVIEEFFLRGFLMRYLIREDWTSVPFGAADAKAIAIVTAVAMAMHPAELIAELAWFSLVTWLMLRTRNIWDCVAAHAVTNLLLGIYVVATGHWELM